jgi:hypothetical protein
MNNDDPVIVELGASIAWDMMPTDLRQRLHAQLVELAALTPEQYPANRVRPIKWVQPAYLLHADDQLRAIFIPGPGGRIHLHDVFLQAAMDRLFGRPSQPPTAV